LKPDGAAHTLHCAVLLKRVGDGSVLYVVSFKGLPNSFYVERNAVVLNSSLLFILLLYKIHIR
jgi:hypothetical protein